MEIGVLDFERHKEFGSGIYRFLGLLNTVVML